MRLEPGYLIGMALQSVPDPRAVARDVLEINLSRLVLWQTLGLLVVVSTFFGVMGAMVFPIDPALYGPVLSDPIMMGIVEASMLVLTVFGIYWIGHAMGGTGRFDQAILTVIWVQFVMDVLKVTVLVLAVFAPLMAVLVQVFAVALMFWIYSNFIAEMHKFQSVGLVFVMILFTLVGLIFGFSIILAVIGVSVGAAAGVM